MHTEQDEDTIISYDKIRELTSELGMDVTWRKLNYYKSLGLLPMAIRKKGDKRGYYPFSVYYDLIVYHFLQNNLGFTLEEIKKLAKEFKSPVLFAKWIQRTYGYFITYAKAKIRADGNFQRNGVSWMARFNGAYKDALLKTGIVYISKSINKSDFSKEVDDDSITKKAGEWAAKAIADTMK